VSVLHCSPRIVSGARIPLNWRNSPDISQEIFENDMFKFESFSIGAGWCQRLNADTIREMHLAFRRGGRAAINKVMKQQPAVFLKLLALLVPREMKVEHTGGVKAMTDEQLEQGIEAITAMLAARDAGTNAKVIEGVAEPVPSPRKTRRTRRKTDEDVGQDMGRTEDAANS
jgi:hypothetical protein